MTTEERDVYDELDDPRPAVLLGLRLVPKVGQPLAQYLIDRRQYKTRQALKTIDHIRERSGLSDEELFERISQNARLSTLFEEAIGIAYRTHAEEKLRAVARAVVTGVLAKDDARIDESEVILRTIADLEMPDIKGLLLFFEANRPRPGAALDPRIVFAGRWSDAVSSSILGHLQSKGLVDNGMSGVGMSFYGGAQWRLTPFADFLIDYLEEAAAAVDSPS